jgi:hypothetical protein
VSHAEEKWDKSVWESTVLWRTHGVRRDEVITGRIEQTAELVTRLLKSGMTKWVWHVGCMRKKWMRKNYDK